MHFDLLLTATLRINHGSTVLAVLVLRNRAQNTSGLVLTTSLTQSYSPCWQVLIPVSALTPFWQKKQ